MITRAAKTSSWLRALDGRRRSLTSRYALLVSALVALTLALNVIVGALFASRDQRVLVARAQLEQARRVADRIDQVIASMFQQMEILAAASVEDSDIDQLRLDGLKLMRQELAIIDLRQARSDGREVIGLSRLTRDRIASGLDLSQEAAFRGALASGSYIGPVVFFRGSEPRIELAARAGGASQSVTIATVNLTFIWDLVSALKVEEGGRAYIATASGRLIAHPDLRYVLRDTHLAPTSDVATTDSPTGVMKHDVEGRSVLSVSAPIGRIGWQVYVDVPESVALAPIWSSLARSVMVGLAALAIALIASVLVSRRMVAPIKLVQEGAARIGDGQLDHRITIDRADEIGALGAEFNKMAAKLEEERAVLDNRVAERTAALRKSHDEAVRQHEAAVEARQIAEQATAAKSRFLAVVGHDIRTPIAAVVGVIGLLDRARMSKHDRRLIEMAASSGEALVDLINGILDLSRLEAETDWVELSDIEPAALARTAIAMLRPDAERKGLDLRLNVDDVGAAFVRTDAVKLNRIVINLLRNAVSFTNAGFVELSLRTERRSADAASTLSVVVRDTGVGIPADLHDHVFDDFVQAEPARSRGGVGLGLAICRRLTMLLGGSLALDSALGTGSVFTLTIPVELVDAPSPTPDQTTTPASLAILVVDDDPLNREVTTGLCRNLGHQVESVGDGRAALDQVRRRAFDVILLDMHMSGMDGAETAAALAHDALDGNPHLIGLTADTSPDTLRRFRAAGVATVLSKPIAQQALAAALRQATPACLEPSAPALAVSKNLDLDFIGDRRAMLGDDRLSQLVQLFHAAAEDLMATIAAAATEGDRVAMARAGHQLASAASAIGLGVLFRDASRLEAAAAKGSAADMRAAVVALGEVCRTTRKELDSYMASLSEMRAPA